MINPNQQYETRSRVEEEILAVYKYGSRVYKCTTEKSDWDYIVIVESLDENLKYSVAKDNVNLTVYSEQNFIKEIKNHHISALECIFQKSNDMFKEYFELNSEKLRRAISSVASNSYVKCKKKIRDGEVYIGKKSLFHSIRILMFGIQIAKHGKIVNYEEANNYHKIIFEMGDDWSELDKEFKPIYNALKSEFKRLAPLESDKVD